MLKLLKKLFRGKEPGLQFSYEEKKYTLGVKVLVLMLAFFILMLSETALSDLSDGIPRVQYPNYELLEEQIVMRRYAEKVYYPLQKRKNEIERMFEHTRGEYDSGLLEDTSGRETSLYGGPDVSAEQYKQLSDELQQVQLDLNEAEREYDIMQRAARGARYPMQKEYESEVRLRQLVLFLWEAVFWLPFFLFALFWHARSRRKESRWEIIALATLLAASFISLQSICALLWSWIPKAFLEWLWEILQATLLTRVVGYYVMIALAIAFFGWCIVIIHRYSTDPVRGGKKKIREGHCPYCSYPLNLSAQHCGGCGKQLTKECDSCGKSGYTWQAACVHCGK